MKLSILLPTLFPNLAMAAIEDWRKQLRGLDHEFVVVCPQEIGGDRVRWIPEATPSGSIAATQLAFAGATGDVIVQAADDVRFAAGAAQEALAAFADPNRVFPLAWAYPHRFGAIDFVWTHFGRLCPTFWAMGRADIERAGGHVDVAYRSGFADPDLGLRIWRAGGQVRRASAVVRTAEDRLGNGESPAKTGDAMAKDFATFHARWAPSFDPVWGNQEVDIALQISVEFLRLLSQDPGTLALDGPAGARDLRIARAISLSANAHNSPVPRAAAEAGLAYLRWVAKLSPDPLQAFVGGWYWAALRSASGAENAAAQGGFPRGRQAP